MQQLVPSSSIQLARIKTLANEGPQMKLGYDNVNIFSFEYLFVIKLTVDYDLIKIHSVNLFLGD